MLSDNQEPKTENQPAQVNPIISRIPLPPPPLGPARTPLLYTTLVGNGRMLVCLDDSGGLAQLFYPHIDAGPHIRTFHIGLQILHARQVTTIEEEIWRNVEVSWLSGPEWVHKLQHVAHAAALDVISTNATAGVRLERSIAAHPTYDILIVELQLTNLTAEPLQCKLVTYAGFDIDDQRSGSTYYFNPETSTATFFARDRFFSLACDAPVAAYAAGKTTVGQTDQLFSDVSTGLYNYRDYAVGQVSGAICHSLGEIASHQIVTHLSYLCCERSLTGIEKLSTSILKERPRVADAIAWWQETYQSAWLDVGSQAVRDTYDRSLITLRLLTDSSTGAIIAAAELDPDFRSSEGYAYCWPRDGALNSNALDVAGQFEQARIYYDWALRVQEPSGVWYQRYYTTGNLASTWGLIQFDETGATIWAICRHIQLSGDIDYGRKVFPQLIRGCEYMHRSLDQETGLAPITKDVWEERTGISAYACANTWGAFHELALLATRLGESEQAEQWNAAANALKAAIQIHLWDPSRQRFLRGLKIQRDQGDLEQLRGQPDFSEADLLETTVMGRKRFVQPQDPIVDSSLLGLSFPFGVFAPDDHRIIATAQAITTHLTCSAGGILRYQNDNYRGGNAWVICTLWLAWHALATNNTDEARRLFDWVINHRTQLDLLPEQLDRTTGTPCWVVPLGWSHAVFIVVARAFAEHHLLL